MPYQVDDEAVQKKEAKIVIEDGMKQEHYRVAIKIQWG